MVRALAALGALVLAPAVASAGGELDLLSPRAIGHAGASLVSDDGAAAVFLCPAAIARRGGVRGQLAGLAVDDAVWLDAPGHPRVRDLGPAELVPLIGVQGGWERVVLGASVAVTESIDRQLPTPADGLPDPAVIADHPHRYAGQAARWTRASVAAAAAVRATDWLAIGATVTLGQVDARETRRIWAGFSGRDGPSSPARDVEVAIAADDRLVPGGAIGALIAPADVPIELALGAAWADDVRATGPVSLAAVRSSPGVEAAGATAHGRFGSALTLAVGMRWLGDRWATEVGAAAWMYPTGQDAWTIDGARVRDESGATATVSRLPTRFARRSHGAVRAAVDVALLPGFLWMSAGWSWQAAGAARQGTTTVGVDAGGHTLGLGLEVSAGAAVITLGLARQLARSVTVERPGLPQDNPFSGGAEPANLGDHGRSRDRIGFGVELALP